MHVLSQANRLLLSLFKRPNLDASPSQRKIILIYLWATITWILLGVHLWFLANAFSDPGARGMIHLIGVISLAMVAGQIAFFLPSGIGAREIVLVTGLQGYVGYEVSIAIALVSRVMFTLSDIAVGLIAATYNRESIESENQ
jgi:K+-sensing histidine kinase KdpD